VDLEDRRDPGLDPIEIRQPGMIDREPRGEIDEARLEQASSLGQEPTQVGEDLGGEFLAGEIAEGRAVVVAGHRHVGP
jgi:hypothetical protein